MSRTQDCWLVVASAGFKRTSVTPQSVGHLPSPLAECVVGGLWSAVRASRAVLKEDLCVSHGWPARPGGDPCASVESARAHYKHGLPSRQREQHFAGIDLPPFLLSVTRLG